jgi:oxygen-independent coproporphyrinogen-3 oxidase
LYIHVPWCRSICSYCDFDRQAHGFELMPAYAEALIADIQMQPALAVHSIFFGGGTPSLLSPEHVGNILGACRRRFRLSARCEITLEANPDDVDSQRARGYIAGGINRLSIGIQSFDDQVLRLLHRRHDAARAREAVRQARLGGIDNLNIDLMYGLPGQSTAHWRTTLEQAIRLEPEHISAYLLTVDDRVPLGRQVERGLLTLPPDDHLVEMYADTQRMLEQAGYEQYEISNWAKPGRACRHNLTYWRDEPYLGIGAGAASSYGGRRWKNTPDPAIYVEAVGAGREALVEDEWPDQMTAAQDYLALSLRLREGLDLVRFGKRFGVELLELGGAELAELLERQVLQHKNGRLRISAHQLLVSNEIIVRLGEAVRQG